MDQSLKDKLIDRFESWELIEFLQISIEDVVDIFEAEIEESMDDVLELLGLRVEEDEGN